MPLRFILSIGFYLVREASCGLRRIILAAASFRKGSGEGILLSWARDRAQRKIFITAVNPLEERELVLIACFGLRKVGGRWQHLPPRLPHGVTVAQQILTLLV